MEKNHSGQSSFINLVDVSRLGLGFSEGLFGLTLIRAPQGVTTTCDITLSACLGRLQTLRGVQRYSQQQPSLVRISAWRSPGLQAQGEYGHALHHREQRHLQSLFGSYQVAVTVN